MLENKQAIYKTSTLSTTEQCGISQYCENLKLEVPHTYKWVIVFKVLLVSFTVTVFDSFFISFLISFFWKNGIKNEQRNNMKNDLKNSVFQKQLSCLFLMCFCFSFIFHPFFVFRFQVAEGCFGVVHSFSSFPIWQLHHSIHRSHYLMSKKIKTRHF